MPRTSNCEATGRLPDSCANRGPRQGRQAVGALLDREAIGPGRVGDQDMLPQETMLKTRAHHLGDVVHPEAPHEVEAMDFHGPAADPKDASRLVIRMAQDD